MNNTLAIIVTDISPKGLKSRIFKQQKLISFEDMISNIYLNSIELKTLKYELIDDSYIYFQLLTNGISPEKSHNTLLIWKEYLHANNMVLPPAKKHLSVLFAKLEQDLARDAKFHPLQCITYLSHKTIQSFFANQDKLMLLFPTELSFALLSSCAKKLELDMPLDWFNKSTNKIIFAGESEQLKFLVEQLATKHATDSVAIIISETIEIETMVRKLKIYDLLFNHNSSSSYQARFDSSYYNLEQTKQLLFSLYQLDKKTMINLDNFLKILMDIADSKKVDAFLLDMIKHITSHSNFWSKQNKLISLKQWTDMLACELMSAIAPNYVYICYKKDKHLYRNYWQKIFIVSQQNLDPAFDLILQRESEIINDEELNAHKDLICDELLFLVFYQKDKQKQQYSDYIDKKHEESISKNLWVSQKNSLILNITSIIDKLDCPHRFILKHRIVPRDIKKDRVSFSWIKKIINNFWSKYQSLEALKQLPDLALRQVLYEEIEFLIRNKKLNLFTNQIQESLAREWLFMHSYRWIDYERTRDNFVFKKANDYLSYLDMKLRIDRVDLILSTGKKLYIHYASNIKAILTLRKNFNVFNTFLKERNLAVALVQHNRYQLHMINRSKITNQRCIEEIMYLKRLSSKNQLTLYEEDTMAKPSKYNCKFCPVSFICKYKF